MNFEAWCYRDVARPRLNREQLMEIAEALRNKGYVSEGDMRECLEAVAYSDIKSRVREEVESRIDSERRKYRELAEQIESERKSFEQEFNRAKCERVLSEIRKLPYASSLHANSEEEMRTELESAIKREVYARRKEAESEMRKIAEEKRRHEERWREQYYQQALRTFLEEARAEIPALEEMEKRIDSCANEREYRSKIREIKQALTREVEELREEYERRMEEINRERERKVKEAERDYEDFANEIREQLKRRMEKCSSAQNLFDRSPESNFTSREEVKRYFKHLESELEHALREAYAHALEAYRKVEERMENYKRKTKIDGRALANEVLDRIGRTLPIDTSGLRRELENGNYNSIKDVEEFIAKRLSEEQEIRSRFESGDFSGLFETACAQAGEREVSEEFYETLRNALKEGLGALDPKLQQELNELEREMRRAEKRVKETREMKSYGAGRLIDEAIEEAERNAKARVSRINREAENAVNSEISRINAICRNRYGFEAEPSEFSGEDWDEKLANYLEHKIDEVAKKAEQKVEERFNTEMKNFERRIEEVNERLRRNLYERFNVEPRSLSELDDYAREVAESVLQRAKNRVEKTYREKLREFEKRKEKLEHEEKNLEERLFEQSESEIADGIYSEYLNHLKEVGLIRMENGKYKINRERVTELLAEKAFEEAAKILKGNRKSRKGTHKSRIPGLGELVLGSTKKTNKISKNLALLPTMRNSVVRRTLKPNEPLITEEDLVEYQTLKNISYAVVIAIDKSSSMWYNGRIEGAKNCALALAHYMRKKHKKDKIRFIVFDDEVKPVEFEDILGIEAEGYTDIGGALNLGRKILNTYRRKEKVLYLITDGYPEGETSTSTKERRRSALEMARKLKKDKINLIEILLDNRDKMVYWGKKIVAEADGMLFHVRDPSDLGAFVIDDFSRRRGGLR